jgi:hypothetical protein
MSRNSPRDPHSLLQQLIDRDETSSKKDKEGDACALVIMFVIASVILGSRLIYSLLQYYLVRPLLRGSNLVCTYLASHASYNSVRAQLSKTLWAEPALTCIFHV